MGVRLNENEERVKTIREGLKIKGGYCPCRMERTEDTKCICREFKEQMADPDFAAKMAEAAYRIREELTSQYVFVSSTPFLLPTIMLMIPYKSKYLNSVKRES